MHDTLTKTFFFMLVLNLMSHLLFKIIDMASVSKMKPSDLSYVISTAGKLTRVTDIESLLFGIRRLHEPHT